MASTSIASRRQQLGRLRTTGVGPWQLTAGQLLDWFAGQPWGTETRRCRRNTYRHFYSWAVESGLAAHSPAAALPKVRPPVPNPMPVPDRIYAEAVARAGDRERLMVRLAGELGLRRAEVAVVSSRDLVEDLDGWSLVVHGKGGKIRLMPTPDSLAAALRALPAGYAFPGDDDGHLSPRWVGRLVGDLLPAPYTMHKLRHRFLTRAYEVEHDLAVVQELAGHTSPVTTRNFYVKIGRDRLRATVNAVAA